MDHALFFLSGNTCISCVVCRAVCLCASCCMFECVTVRDVFGKSMSVGPEKRRLSDLSATARGGV
jgi:hypothetical protein